MKRRIYWSLCVLSLAAMLVSVAAVLCASYGFFSGRLKTELRSRCEYIASGVNGTDAGEFLSKVELSDPVVRITRVAADGQVLFDSAANPQSLSNHLDRPEVGQALETGRGQSSRKSDTLNQSTYYYAVRLEDGTVLRLSQDISSITTVFLGILPLVVLLIVLIVAACLYLSRLLTDRIVKPLTVMVENLDDGVEIADGYEELAPFLTKISKQNKLIKQQLTEMEEDQDTINLIMDNMREGLILLSAGRKILTVNRGAIDYLNAEPKDYSGQNIVALSRNAALLEAVNSAISGRPASGMIVSGEEEKRRGIQLFASPVWNSGQDGSIPPAVTGVILFLLDVTEQVRAEKIRQEFSANVSHELKTPLTSITGFAEMMMNGMVETEEERKRFSGMIYDESKRLLTMIDDIMRLSQIEEGGDEKPLVKVNLYTLARGVCTSMRELADARGISLNTTGENVIVQGNLSMLHEMICNLVDNAIKYNRNGGVVDVEVHEEDGKAVLIVSDNGIGIPEEHRERIFERFYRADKSRSKQTGGTGLGLSIVKHIVEYHGGSISLDSEEDVGTTVTVTL